jgi:hypothetical protein
MQNLTRDDSGSLEKLEREHNDYVSRVDDPPVLSQAVCEASGAEKERAESKTSQKVLYD